MTKHTKFSERSVLRKSVQPILIFACLLLLAYIAYRAYVAIQNAMKYAISFFSLFYGWDIDRRTAQENLKKKGFSIEGSRANLRVKGIDETRYLDETQRYGFCYRLADTRAFVKAWQNSETKGYYSRLWSKEPPKKE